MRIILGICSLVLLSNCKSTSGDGDANKILDAASVRQSVKDLTSDGVLDASEVAKLFQSAGERISAEEGLVIWNAVRKPSGFTVPADAVKKAEQLALTNGVPADQVKLLESGKSFAGTTIPAEVRKVLLEARLAGAVAYDVRDPDPKDTDPDSHEGYWSPYPQALDPVETMTFAYTEITPQKLKADMADTNEDDRANGEVSGKMTYVKDKCLSARGNIQTEYDEAIHPKIYARGSSCQKWANNCGIMVDGTLHCIAASRRVAASGDDEEMVLTNPSLAREKLMLWNGHLDAVNGEIKYIGMSGRIAKRAAKNEFAFVDPVPLLKAWGFKVSSGLKTVSEHNGTSSDFRNHSDTATVRGPN